MKIHIEFQENRCKFESFHCNGSVSGTAVGRFGSMVYTLPSQAAAWDRTFLFPSEKISSNLV